jgi:hypothetical protein
VNVLIRLPQSRARLSRAFQVALDASIECAAEWMRLHPLPALYRSHIRYQHEPWAGEEIEEFADPYTVWKRGWGDCDDLVIFRGGELRAAGLRCHPRILHELQTDKYHTQLTRDFDGVIEDPSLQRLGRSYLWRL